MMQLLYEATITDVPLDLNTYIKALSAVYFDHDLVLFDRKDFITYLYTLFSNDNMVEDFTFGCELLQEYIESNFSEFSSQVNTSNSQSKKKKKNKGQQE
jgi:hypothetical protein